MGFLPLAFAIFAFALPAFGRGMRRYAGFLSTINTHMPLTLEQEDAIRLFCTQEKLKVNAYAGTGKTFTLRAMAEAEPQRRGKYLAFNRAIASHALATFPNNIDARTSHSLAFRAIIANGFSSAQMTQQLSPNAIARVLGLQPIYYTSSRSLSTTGFGYLVGETIRSFCYSASESIHPGMVVLPGSLQLLDPLSKEELIYRISAEASNLWQQMIDPRQELFPLGHDGYFKLWSLAKPQIKTDFILLDEAQDSNPALLSVLNNQNAQVVYVGDQFQQIYEWRQAVNAMTNVSTKWESYLTNSFRFGDAIAGLATQIIRLLEPRAEVRGATNIESVLYCSNPDAILSRTNANLIAQLMIVLEEGRKPWIEGGVVELRRMLEDVVLLRSGRPGNCPEFFGFNNWQEVEEFVLQPEGSSLMSFVNIVRKFGEDRILAALQYTAVDKSHADVSLSTVHKAKGLEWNAVLLTDDFPEPQLVSPQNEKKLLAKGCVIFTSSKGYKYAILPEEVRLLYVAVTRARHAVQVPKWCYSFFSISNEIISSNNYFSKASDVQSMDLEYKKSVRFMDRNSPSRSGDGFLLRAKDIDMEKRSINAETRSVGLVDIYKAIVIALLVFSAYLFVR